MDGGNQIGEAGRSGGPYGDHEVSVDVSNRTLHSAPKKAATFEIKYPRGLQSEGLSIPTAAGTARHKMILLANTCC